MSQTTGLRIFQSAPVTQLANCFAAHSQHPAPPHTKHTHTQCTRVCPARNLCQSAMTGRCTNREQDGCKREAQHCQTTKNSMPTSSTVWETVRMQMFVSSKAAQDRPRQAKAIISTPQKPQSQTHWTTSIRCCRSQHSRTRMGMMPMLAPTPQDNYMPTQRQLSATPGRISAKTQPYTNLFSLAALHISRNHAPPCSCATEGSSHIPSAQGLYYST
jgi:hypothetical protein